MYDKTGLQLIPASQIEVAIQELSLTTKTDDAGRYVFPGLPAGSFTVRIEDSGRQITYPVHLGGGPTVISNLDFTLSEPKPGRQ